ncbi:hypothetical protein NQU59_16550 [Acinetobacter colistiniresistens]|uniref:hypothetical protein n=1 Tax=Acinetobacter colistiniresistens TaxID=280145 RepID=UPI00211CE222|nr:hypothetical protein [Acinetobacter colistiniresistens]UUM27252.1 hypothetical protein NQU59_16550 [Acinetobacter colistiniresistens]
MMKKILATLIACFILVGLVVIFYWRDIQYQPESADLINYFLILPVVISLLLLSPWLIYKTYQHYKEKKQRVLQAEQEQEHRSTELSLPVLESKWLELNLYAAGAYSALGENDSILDGIKKFSSPQLDQNLVNFHGIPILSYRIEELDQQIQNTDDEDLQFLSVRQQRIMTLIHHQIEQHTELLASIADHLKRSSLFYESQNLHEYRMHPAWIDPSFSGDEEREALQVEVEQIYRLDKLNLHILLSEDVVHTWNDQSSNESIQAIFYDLGMIPQKFHIEYHYLSAASTEQYLLELLDRIQNQAHEVSLVIAADSEIDQEIIDEKSWGAGAYIPSEFVSSSCLAHPAVQLERLQPEKTFKLVSNQNNLDQIFQELKLDDLPQYQAEEPFVLVVEDGTDVKVAKKLEQFFKQSPVEAHHYLYCKPIFGHSQNVAKLFGIMLGAHFSESHVAFVYGHNLKAFIQAVPEITQDQESVAIAD